MTGHKRLRFDRRAETPPRMRLTKRDIKVIKAVYEHRLLRRDQIQLRFFPSKMTANRRLQRLYHHGYLDRIWLPESARQNARNTQPTYCLDKAGADLLAAEFGIPREQIDWYPDLNMVKEDFHKHQLRINDFRLMLTLAAEERGDEIERWVPERKLPRPEQVIDPNDGKTYPVAPDAYFIYKRGDTGKRAHFFLEMDMGTMQNPKFAKKIKAYILYWETDAYVERYQTYSLKVLSVTTGKVRARNLKRTTEEAGGKSMFWFTSWDQLESEDVLGPVWHIAGQSELASLLDEAPRG